MKDATHFIEIWRDKYGDVRTEEITPIFMLDSTFRANAYIGAATLFIWKYKLKPKNKNNEKKIINSIDDYWGTF